MKHLFPVSWICIFLAVSGIRSAMAQNPSAAERFAPPNFSLVER